MQNTRHKGLRNAIWLFAFGLLVSPFCMAQESVTLAWDANSELDIAGYRLHYGEQSGNYTTTVDAGNVLTATVGDLAAGKTYFFVVTAYNTAAVESLPSNEASFTAGPPLTDQFRGSYSGAFSNGPEGVSASVKLALSKRGRFTGKLLLGTSIYRLRGRFDGNGQTTLLILSADGYPITVILELDPSTGSVRAEVYDGGAVANINLSPRVFSRENPASEKGKYTLLMGGLTPVAGSEPVVPVSAGFASLVISKSGNVRAAGRLADGQAFTVKALLRNDATFSVHSLLYSKEKGLLAGQVAIRETAGVSDGDGSLSWIKPGGATKRFYTGGFSGTVSAQLSRFEEFSLGSATSSSGIALASLSGGELPTAFDPLVKELAFPGGNVIGVLNPSGEKLRLTVNPGNALVHGSFLHPADGRKRTIFGMMFQKNGTGGGFFPGVQTTGTFGLLNVPHPE